MPYSIPGVQPNPGWGDYLGDSLGNISDLLLKAVLSGIVTGKRTGGTSYSQAGAGQGFPQAPLASPPQTARPVSPRFAGFQVQPDLSRQLQQAQLGYLNAATGQLAQPTATTPSTAATAALKISSPLLNSLHQKAQSGDVGSMDSLRLLALEKNDPEAIAILQSLGEL